MNGSLYEVNHESRAWHEHLDTRMKSLDYEQFIADAFVVRLVREGSISITALVHVDNIVAVGRRSRRDRLCENLNHLLDVDNLGELSWYTICRFPSDNDSWTSAENVFAGKMFQKVGPSSLCQMNLV